MLTTSSLHEPQTPDVYAQTAVIGRTQTIDGITTEISGEELRYALRCDRTGG